MDGEETPLISVNPERRSSTKSLDSIGSRRATQQDSNRQLPGQAHNEGVIATDFNDNVMTTTKRASPTRASDGFECPSGGGKKAATIELRSEIRNYIRNERDTTLKKWMALKESIKSEDVRRDQFLSRRLREDARILPVQIEKLIGNLKRSVHKTMREKGGTPFSILRQMFLYWDAKKLGYLSMEDLTNCLNSLGIEISEFDRREIFNHYATRDHGMGYHELLLDIQRDEPSMIAFVEDQHADEKISLRFEERADHYTEMPEIVKRFIEATRYQVQHKMRVEGGTMYYHVRKIFQKFDFDYSNALSPSELFFAARKNLDLAMTEQDARDIVDYYDRKRQGEMMHSHFIDDVCVGLTSILEFNTRSAESIAEEKRKIQSNQFIRTPFKAKANKLLENIKLNVRRTLDIRVNSSGGSYKSWIKEAFTFWDPRNIGRISDWTHLQGAMKRLGATLSEEEAQAIMLCYDEDNSGSMNYQHLMTDILEGEPNFMSDSTTVTAKLLSSTASARAPKEVDRSLNKIKRAVDVYVRKSKGSLEGRDLVSGTFIRFDPTLCGKVGVEEFKGVCGELKVNLSDREIVAMVTWYDTTGRQRLDYNELCRELFGEDLFIKPLGSSLPSLTKSFAGSKSLNSSIAGSLTSSMNSFTDGSTARPFTNLTALASGPPADKSLMIETKLIKEARRKIRRNVILQERAHVQNRLDSIEKQRKRIIEDHKKRKGAQQQQIQVA